MPSVHFARALCARYARAMRALCVRYARAMRPLCAPYARAMRALCARYARAMRALCARYVRLGRAEGVLYTRHVNGGFLCSSIPAHKFKYAQAYVRHANAAPHCSLKPVVAPMGVPSIELQLHFPSICHCICFVFAVIISSGVVLVVVRPRAN